MATNVNSLTLQASPGIVTFALVSKGTALGSSGVSIVTSWDSNGTLPQLTLFGYFASSTSALSDGRTPSHLIPSSAISGSVSTGVPTSFTPFTQTNAGFGAAGASLLLVNANMGHTGSRTDVLNLQINLSSLPTLPAGTYTGTLTIQASIN